MADSCPMSNSKCYDVFGFLDSYSQLDKGGEQGKEESSS